MDELRVMFFLVVAVLWIGQALYRGYREMHGTFRERKDVSEMAEQARAKTPSAIMEEEFPLSVLDKLKPIPQPVELSAEDRAKEFPLRALDTLEPVQGGLSGFDLSYQPAAFEKISGEFPLAALNRLGKRPRPRMISQAITAAERAEVLLDAAPALAIDLGLLVYDDGIEKPTLHRDAPIMDSVDAIQPFVELWVEQPTRGEVVFTLHDASGAVRFHAKAAYDIPGGQRTVLCPTRLPVGDHLALDGDWELRIEVTHKTIARHAFRWYDPASDDVLAEHLAEDGELTVDLAALVEQVTLAPLSLDELLDENGRQDDVTH